MSVLNNKKGLPGISVQLKQGQQNEQTCFNDVGLGNWYAPVLIGPSTIGEYASSHSCLLKVIDVLRQLQPDEFINYLLAYYDAGISRFGERWRYADITTVLMAAAEITRPRAYLEIGVRRGRSMAMVAAAAPECAIAGFDLWAGEYAGMANPGPDFVRDELKGLGHKGDLTLIAGDSHRRVPEYLAANPDLFFDMITVDGDHSRAGAVKDLRTVTARLSVGGVLVFDDIVHPSHPYLGRLWRKEIASDPKFACWNFDELGYGVALAIRKY